MWQLAARALPMIAKIGGSLAQRGAAGSAAYGVGKAIGGKIASKITEGAAAETSANLGRIASMNLGKNDSNRTETKELRDPNKNFDNWSPGGWS